MKRPTEFVKGQHWRTPGGDIVIWDMYGYGRLRGSNRRFTYLDLELSKSAEHPDWEYLGSNQ